MKGSSCMHQLKFWIETYEVSTAQIAMLRHWCVQDDTDNIARTKIIIIKKDLLVKISLIVLTR